jgi:hypothetical protein
LDGKSGTSGNPEVGFLLFRKAADIDFAAGAGCDSLLSSNLAGPVGLAHLPRPD